MSTIDHINGGFFRKTENALALIDVDEIFLLDDDFDRFGIW
jgi:hypothetical protein